MRAIVAVCGLLAASACVNPSARIATELTRYGLDSGRAQCVGQRIERDLSVPQLQELAGAARAYGADDATPGRLTVSDLVRVAHAIRDPEVPLAVARAAAGCGVSVADVVG